MVELRQLTGSPEETRSILRVPFSVGRDEADWNLSGVGIWPRHLIVEKGAGRGFQVIPQPPATVVVGGRLVDGPCPLRNGDVIELGGERIQFRVSATRQRSLGALEMLTWTALALLAALQVGLSTRW